MAQRKKKSKLKQNKLKKIKKHNKTVTISEGDVRQQHKHNQYILILIESSLEHHFNIYSNGLFTSEMCITEQPSLLLIPMLLEKRLYFLKPCLDSFQRIKTHLLSPVHLSIVDIVLFTF